MLTFLIDEHYTWLQTMGWMKHETPLELLALLASEVGEAVNECRQGEPSDRFGEELADIVLRAGAIARRFDIDLEAEMIEKIRKNDERGNRGRTI